MNDEMFEKFCADKVELLKSTLQEAAKEAISEISNEYLPYVVGDTLDNVGHRAESIIAKMLSGDYEVCESGNSLTIKEPYAFISIRVTANQWDNFRRELIKIMPKCPKDLEIENLKSQLRTAYGSHLF
jgi:hypothetical protein